MGVTDHEFGQTGFPMIVGSNERFICLDGRRVLILLLIFKFK
jgi:hypothetical protein